MLLFLSPYSLIPKTILNRAKPTTRSNNSSPSISYTIPHLSVMTTSTRSPKNVMHWFRKGLRLTDNPALIHAIDLAQKNKAALYPVYILDGDSYALKHGGVLRAQFLVQSLQDLDQGLRQRGSRLFVVKADKERKPQQVQAKEKGKQRATGMGKAKKISQKRSEELFDAAAASISGYGEGTPAEVLAHLWKQWHCGYCTWDEDESGEIYAHERDRDVLTHAQRLGVQISIIPTETLMPMAAYVQRAGGMDKVPVSMTGFQALMQKMCPVPNPIQAPQIIPAPTQKHDNDNNNNNNNNNQEATVMAMLPPKSPTDLPWPRNTPRDQVTPLWGPKDCHNLTPIVHGGETAALQQLQKSITDRPVYVSKFEKPKTSCTSIQPSTTILSPYLAWGCISPRTVWYAIQAALDKSKRLPVQHTQPPVSLLGQLMWRDFNYLMAHTAGPGNWNRIQGNKYCRVIPWDSNPEMLDRWKRGMTGFPWIDACMRQLNTQGWIHHLGRHAAACFLTRGDLWQSWEQGLVHFEAQLLDADYAINGFNWLWLSCSGFFYQYFRCYSPVAFQKSNDPTGTYIRHFIPELRKFPDAYIYEPWKAPLEVQKRVNVIIGKDYPKPIVDHAIVSQENMAKMKRAYDDNKGDKVSTLSSASAATKGKRINISSSSRSKDANGVRKKKKT